MVARDRMETVYIVRKNQKVLESYGKMETCKAEVMKLAHENLQESWEGMEI